MRFCDAEIGQGEGSKVERFVWALDYYVLSAVEDDLAKDRCVDQQLVVLEYGQVCLRTQDGLDVGGLFDIVDRLDGSAEVHLCYFWVEVQDL